MHIGICGPIFIPSLNLKYNGDRSGWPNGMGGVPVNHLINGLLEMGFKISIFTSSPEIPVGKSFEWSEENLSLYMGPYRKRARNRCAHFFAIERKYIKNAIFKAKPDFVHAHWQYEWAWGALDSRFPTLVTCHDSPCNVFKKQTDLYRFFRLIIAVIVLRKAKYLTTVSEYCKKGLMTFTSKKIAVIPNFEPYFVFDYYKPKNARENKRISIAMVNNDFTSLKNVQIGISAFNELRKQNSNFELHLFGNSFGINESAYQWCIDRFGIDNIYFHGSLQFNELMQNLSKMDIFVHTSLEESFGMVLVEAMAMGIPVIAGINSGGTECILRDGGILVDVTKVSEVRNAILSLTDKSLYDQLSHKAREIAIKRFSQKIVLEQYLIEYRKLVSHSAELNHN